MSGIVSTQKNKILQNKLFFYLITMIKHIVLNLNQKIFKESSSLLKSIQDFEDYEFEITFYHKETSRAFDYMGSSGRALTHDPGGSDHELVIEAVTFHDSEDKTNYVDHLSEEGKEQLATQILERINLL